MAILSELEPVTDDLIVQDLLTQTFSKNVQLLKKQDIKKQLETFAHLAVKNLNFSAYSLCLLSLNEIPADKKGYYPIEWLNTFNRSFLSTENMWKTTYFHHFQALVGSILDSLRKSSFLIFRNSIPIGVFTTNKLAICTLFMSISISLTDNGPTDVFTW